MAKLLETPSLIYIQYIFTTQNRHQLLVPLYVLYGYIPQHVYPHLPKNNVSLQVHQPLDLLPKINIMF